MVPKTTPMNNREKILNAIAAGKPAPLPMPVQDLSCISSPADLVAAFESMVQAVGGQVLHLNTMEEIQAQILTEKAKGNMVISRLGEAPEQDVIPADLHRLGEVRKAFFMGSMGVAENGAVWVEESAMGNRILSFICEHLVLVIQHNSLVANMHEAYQRIRINQEGFGVFIAGPSKTADIEQSLVIGAHGPKGLTVVLLSS